MTIPTIVKPAPQSDKGLYSKVIAKRALIAGVGVLTFSTISAFCTFLGEINTTPVWESGETASLMCSFDHATSPSKSISSMKATQNQTANGFNLLWADGFNQVIEDADTAGDMEISGGVWSFDGSAQDFTLTSSTGSVINCQ